MTRKEVKQLIAEAGYNPKDYIYTKFGSLWCFRHNNEYYIQDNRISADTAKTINETQSMYKAVFISLGSFYAVSKR